MKILSIKRIAKDDVKSQVSRLNRISGQIEGIKRMIEGRRPCEEVLMQLRSARAAIKSLEGNMLTLHIQSCVRHAFGDEKEQDRALSEIQTLFSRFEN